MQEFLLIKLMSHDSWWKLQGVQNCNSLFIIIITGLIFNILRIIPLLYITMLWTSLKALTTFEAYAKHSAVRKWRTAFEANRVSVARPVSKWRRECVAAASVATQSCRWSSAHARTPPRRRHVTNSSGWPSNQRPICRTQARARALSLALVAKVDLRPCWCDVDKLL